MVAVVKSGGHLQRFHLQWFDWENFGILEKSLLIRGVGGGCFLARGGHNKSFDCVAVHL